MSTAELPRRCAGSVRGTSTRKIYTRVECPPLFVLPSCTNRPAKWTVFRHHRLPGTVPIPRLGRHYTYNNALRSLRLLHVVLNTAYGFFIADSHCRPTKEKPPRKSLVAAEKPRPRRQTVHSAGLVVQDRQMYKRSCFIRRLSVCLFVCLFICLSVC